MVLNQFNTPSIIGQTFTNLTVIGKSDKKDNQNKRIYYICTCICGNITKVKRAYLISGRTKSCGCYSRGGEGFKEGRNKLRQNNSIKRNEYIGQTFNFLTVLESGLLKQHKHPLLCRCICGNITPQPIHALVSGKVKSCGCMKSELVSKSRGGTGRPEDLDSENTRAFISRTPEYFSWKHAIHVRANHKCELSNIPFSIKNKCHIHHKIPLTFLIKKYSITKQNYLGFSSILFDLKNGIALLKSLHFQFHKQYGFCGDESMVIKLYEFQSFLN